uniref:AP-3 complex subunit beta n=1 Tax=Globisporangium ultimum (strain ATCC 200006 / CBS 805.95 / DAOM BR144) TaxID=431595 RepID=K3WFQ3_GLOUD
MALAMKGISGDAHFFEESMNWDRIRKLLDNKLGVAGHAEKLEAMKALLASISKGEDVAMFFADVVKNVIVASVEVKKLVYMYLVHYADANSQCRELALLSINSFQKDLADPNQLIRALALRVMTSIRVRDILQIQLIAIRKCTADSSAYVRKCAANAISKIFVVDPEQKDVLAEIIGKLLNDSSTMVLGSAVQALSEVCPDRLDLLHQPFRKICHLLADLDEWGQTVTINVLIRYCHEQFQSPQRAQEDENQNNDSKRKQNVKEMFPKRKNVKRGFYSDDDDDGSDVSDKRRSGRASQQSPFLLGGSNKQLPSIGSVFRSDALASGIGGGEELDEDHRLLLRSSIPLLKSRNSAVVLAVATLHYYCGTHSVATSTLIGKSLVRIMRSQREIQYVVLSVIASMAASRPDMFRPFLQDFFVRATDPAYARKLKLEIMTALVTEDNVSVILREFQAYVRHVDKSFVTTTVRALGRVADAMPSVAERCLNGLMRLVRSSNERVVAESVVVIRQLLQQRAIEHDRLRVVRSLAAMMVTGRVTSASARASIVWMLGEFNDDGDSTATTACAAETLRLLVKNFSDEATEVRIQLLNLAVKLGLREPQKRTIQLLLQYVIELCKFDTEYDVRDRARLIRATLSGDATIVNPHKVFASKKPAPLIGCEEETKRRFTLGTLSDIVRHSVPGYAPLPHWRTEKPDSSLRDESSHSFQDEASPRGGSRHSNAKKKDSKRGASGFYSEDDRSSASSDGSSGSESESGSDASSEYESESDEESDRSEPTSSRSGSDYDSDASSSAQESDAEEDEASSSEEDSEDDRRRRGRHSNRKGKAASVSLQKKRQPKQQADLLDPLGFLDTTSSSATFDNSNQQQHAFAPIGGQNTNGNSANSLLGDLMNLSMATTSTLPATRRELLSSLTGNGLDIQYSFLRQPSMYSPSMNLIQLWISNNSDAAISRIQVMAKNQTQQVMSFPEIPVLFPGGTPSMAQLHVDFAGRLDKVALQVITNDDKFDVDLAPVSGELLAPQQMSLEEFGQRIARTDPSSLHTSDFFLPVPVQLDTLVQAVVKDSNMAQVYEFNNVTPNVGKCKFAGRLRGGSMETVLLGVEYQVQTGKTRLLVVSSDVVFAQRLVTNIKRNLPIQSDA